MTRVSNNVAVTPNTRSRSALVTAIAAMALTLTGCAGSASDNAALTAGPVTTSAPNTVAGQPFSLLIHCGIKYTSFDGNTWEALPPIPSIPTTTTDPATGISGNRYSIAGTMRRISENEAEFITTDDQANLHIRFQLTHAALPGCA